MALSLEQRLTRFERSNRSLFYLGAGLMVSVVVFWGIVVFNAPEVNRLLRTPTAQDKIWIRDLQVSVSAPSPREDYLMELARGLILQQSALLRTLIAGCIVINAVFGGMFLIGFARYEKKVLDAAREALLKP